MTQEYTPVEWVDETENQVGTVINKARLDQMQTAHHFADGFKEVDTVPTADPGVNYHMVVFCTADTTFYRWNGTQWVKDVDDSTLALLEAHEANHNNPHVVTKDQVGLGNVDNTSDADKPVSSATQTALDGKVDDTQIVSTWQPTPDNAHIPTEKLVKDSLDDKVDKLVTKPPAGTYTKLTINAEGQVTAVSTLAATDIPSLDWSKITSGKPTTLAGYGITDAVNTTGDQTGIAGAKTWIGVQKITADNNTLGFIMKSSNIKRSDSVGGFTRLNQLQLQDMNGDTTGYIQNYLDGTGYLITNYGTSSPSGTNRELRIASGTSDGYATIPYRAYNSANVNDIVTIGSLASNPNVVHTTGNEVMNGTLTVKSMTFDTKNGGLGETYCVLDNDNTTINRRARLVLGVLSNGNVQLYLEKYELSTGTRLGQQTILTL